METSYIIYTIIILVMLFAFLAGGSWIAIGLAATGLFCLAFLGKGGMQGILGGLMFNALNSYILMALPIFIFMGELMLRSGTSGHLYKGVSKWLSIIPGGLLHSQIVSCAIFAACSGSSTATEVAIGSGSVPELLKRGYDKKITLGSIAAGCTLGILIPPSIIMLVFGAFVGVSVGKLFIGGIIPGLMLAGVFMLWIVVASFFPKIYRMPVREKLHRTYFIQAIKAIKDVWPSFLIMFFIMGSIYTGFATPTEAAAVAVMVTFLLTIAYYKTFSFRVLKEALTATVVTTSFIMLCMVGARTLGMAMSMLRIPAELCQMVGCLEVSPYIIWIIIVFLYAILGCLMDGLNLMFVTVPVTFPLVVNVLGFDPIWFGVVLTIILEMSLITPPVGLNLYVAHNLGGGGNLKDTIVGVIPFVLCMFALIALLTAIPSLVTWLPNTMFPPR